MKRLLVLAALLAVIVACAVVAHATPSYTSATGGVALPDVKTTPAGVLDIALDYQRQKLAEAQEATNARVTYGLGTNSEIGIKYTWQSAVSTPKLENWGASFKYVLPVKYLDLDVATGITYAKYKYLDTKQIQLYAVGGANVWQSYEGDRTLDINIGINWTKFEVPGSDIKRFRAFTVADYKFSNSMHLIGEYQTEARMDNDPLSSLALRYSMDENFAWQFGITNAFRAVTGGSEHNLFLGASYNFTQFHEK